MLKKFLLIFTIFILLSSSLHSEEELDYYKIDDSLYSLNNTGTKLDDEINNFVNDFYIILLKISNDIKTTNKYNLDNFYRFISNVNDQSLIGILTRDSYLLYTRNILNKPMQKLLNKYLSENNDADNIDSIEYILSKKEKDNKYILPQK